MKPNARIIQMASAAAFVPQADFAVYAASKSYVLSFTRALGRELREDGIFVTAVCPGPVNTPFFDIAERTGTTLAIKKYTMVEAKEVVHLAIRDSLAGRSVSVCGLPMKAVRVLTKTLPHSFVLMTMDLMKKLGE
jgi:short-subunit dehydrogenase